VPASTPLAAPREHAIRDGAARPSADAQPDEEREQHDRERVHARAEDEREQRKPAHLVEQAREPGDERDRPGRPWRARAGRGRRDGRGRLDLAAPARDDPPASASRKFAPAATNVSSRDPSSAAARTRRSRAEDRPSVFAP
jgi:hypothetical protein